MLLFDWRRRLVAGAAVAVLLVALADLSHFSQGWVQFGYRFSNDFAPFAVILVTLGIDELVAAFPEFGGIDSEPGKQDFVLHEGGTEGLIVVVNNPDYILWSGHVCVSCLRKDRRGKPRWPPAGP